MLKPIFAVVVLSLFAFFVGCKTTQHGNASDVQSINGVMKATLNADGETYSVVCTDGTTLPRVTAADLNSGNPVCSAGSGVATYACDAFGTMSISLLSMSGDQFSFSQRVGAEDDCQWFVKSFSQFKTNVRFPTVVAVCDVFGKMTKIRVVPSGAPSLIEQTTDSGSADACRQYATRLNSLDAKEFPATTVDYWCDAFGTLSVAMLTMPDGKRLTSSIKVGGQSDCQWFTNTWASRKSKLIEPTLVAACDVFGKMTKVRLDPKTGVVGLGTTSIGSESACRDQASQINDMDAHGGAKAHVTYQCDAFGSLSIRVISLPDGQVIGDNVKIGSADDCSWFVNGWAAKKADISGSTLVAGCDVFGKLTKARVDARKGVLPIGTANTGGSASCQQQATQLNNLAEVGQ